MTLIPIVVQFVNPIAKCNDLIYGKAIKIHGFAGDSFCAFSQSASCCGMTEDYITLLRF